LSIVEELKREKREEWAAQDKMIDVLVTQEIHESRVYKERSTVIRNDRKDQELYAEALARVEATEGKYTVESLYLGDLKDKVLPVEVSKINLSQAVEASVKGEITHIVLSKEGISALEERKGLSVDMGDDEPRRLTEAKAEKNMKKKPKLWSWTQSSK
jgi:hypothetical protein